MHAAAATPAPAVSVSKPARPPVMRSGTLARARYRCRTGRASVRFTLSKALAVRIRTSGITTGEIRLGAGAATATFSISVASASVPGQFWGQDGGLQCNLYGRDRGPLVAPNFTVTPDATIDVRP